MRLEPPMQAAQFSVVICNYNYAAYVVAAIESVLAQTLPAYELIVVDDGSTDHSVSLIRQRFPQVRLIEKPNGGQISAYNKGFEQVNGEFVVFLDADDCLLPDALARIAAAFTAQVVKVHYRMRLISQQGDDLNRVLPQHLDAGDCGRDLMTHGALYKSPPASGNAYRVSALRQMFPIPVNTLEKHSADFYCIYGVALLGQIAAIDEPLFLYRLHSHEAEVRHRLSFGNALHGYDIQTTALSRWILFRQWVLTFTHGRIRLPKEFHDFTQQKLFLSLAALHANNLRQKSRVIKRHFFWVVRAIALRRDFNLAMKCGLVVWALLVMILPKPLAFPLAKKVCNPL